jgi:hypothetical protein
MGEMLDGKPIMQFAYVVADLEAACQKWIDCFGAGPFYIVRHLKLPNQLYRGAQTEEDCSHALGFAGDINIHLIQQHADSPSIYRDMYAVGEEGFHHAMFFTNEFEADVERLVQMGCPAVEEMMSTARVTYVDARKKIGGFIEVYEDNPTIREWFADWKETHLTWDRKTDPIRLLG